MHPFIRRIKPNVSDEEDPGAYPYLEDDTVSPGWIPLKDAFRNFLVS